MPRLPDYWTFPEMAKRVGIITPRLTRIVEHLKLDTYYVGGIRLIHRDHLTAVRAAIKNRTVRVGRPATKNRMTSNDDKRNLKPSAKAE